MALRAKVKGKWRTVSPAMARRFRARGVLVEDTAATPAPPLTESDEDTGTEQQLVDVDSFQAAAATLASEQSPAEVADSTPDSPIEVLAELLEPRELQAQTVEQGAAVAAEQEPALVDVPEQPEPAGPTHLEFKGSSNLRQATLDVASGVVAVDFANGKTYRYANFTTELMLEWQAAKSAGSWFHHNVRKSDRHPVVGDGDLATHGTGGE